MKQVFISYSTCDQDRTLEIRQMLERKGISCWMGNRDISGGDNYTESIIKGIRECRIFILILTENAQQSRYVFRELDHAIKKGKIVIPLLMEDVPVCDKFDFLISSCQGIKFYDDPGKAHQVLLDRVSELLSENRSRNEETGILGGALFAQKPDSGAVKKRRRAIVCPHCKSARLKDSISIREYAVENPDVGAMIAVSLLTLVFLVILSFVLDYSAIFAEWSVLDKMMDDPITDRIYNALRSLCGMLLEWGIAEPTARTITMVVDVAVSLAFYLSMFFLFVGVIVLYTFTVNNFYSKKMRKKRYFKGISVWTFRCDDCNTKFSKTIQLEEQSSYYIKEYVHRNKDERELLEDLLIFLKACSRRIWTCIGIGEN